MSVVSWVKSDEQLWAWWYLPDNRKVWLPNDSYSQQYFLSQGFSYVPHQNPKPVTQSLEDKYVIDTYNKGAQNEVEFTCEKCGESFDSNWRLGVHRRTHERKRKARN